jgi:hypothetical protein
MNRCPTSTRSANHRPTTSRSANPFPTPRRANPFPILLLTLLAACQHPEKPVTDPEAIDFANRIESSVALRNEEVLDNIIDPKYFAGLVLRDANDRFNYSLAAKAQAKVAEIHMGQTVLKVVGKTGSYELVRHYIRDSHQHLLFRLVGEDGQLDYHDFELVHGDKSVRAVDLYNYGTGEQLSKSAIETLLEAEKLSRMTDADRDNNRLILEAQKFLIGGNPEEAWQFFVQLPDSLRKKPENQRLHVRIANKLGDSARKAALAEYLTNYPQDPFIYLSMFTSDLNAKDFQSALFALNKLETFLPTDPFLDFYRALIYKAMNDPLQSRIALKRLHAWKPDNFNVIVMLVDNEVYTGHPDSAAILIREARAHKVVTPEQIEQAKTIYPSLRPYLK